ncbi:phosphotransferase family protein [Actinomarinicola tropica]|uniref:phosphotransferase family protein n=1 Tax=Actinomarinicola tropica TaxID=2789776 RepID=UPI001E579529|nr:phosphotransferase family protein [Actinomarinicola tropica]
MSEDVKGIQTEQVTEWFRAHAPAVEPPLTFDLIAGGHSNLTYKVTDQDGRRWVLRRPPLGQVLATAHDMGREHRIISALAPTDVPVAPTVGLCTDEAVNGAPFYVMDFVDGLVIRAAEVGEQLTPEQRRAAGESLVDTMARIHAVDVDAVGLGDLGRKEDYLARQLKRWYGQWNSSKTRELPAVDEVHDHLVAHLPPQHGATIVHGDYRLDNCLVSPEGDVVAVLDWEICTLGDPLADLGLLMVYWADPEDDASGLLSPATALPGFPNRQELVDRYAAASGRDVSNLPVYVAFGYWKLACIVEGVYARYLGGSMGTSDPAQFEVFKSQVEHYAESARRHLELA